MKPHGSSESSACARQAEGCWAVGERFGADLDLIGFARPIAMRKHSNMRLPMDPSLSFATSFWLIVPMCGIVLLSLITYLMGK